MIKTFYIYVDGSDLDEIAPSLRSRIRAFVEPYRGRVRIVDQRAAEHQVSADFPDWDLGVNFEFDALTAAEKKDLVLLFQILSAEFGRDFIVGAVLANGQTDDMLAITAGESLDGVLNVLLANENGG